MKKIYLITLFAINSFAINLFAQSNACNELFISEIVYAKDTLSITGNSPMTNSYAIELFNPRGSAINLSDYYIKMYAQSNNVTSIPLSGNIDSKGTFVLGFALSDSAILEIAEMLSHSLDFTRQNSLELWGPNGLIDKVGETNLTQADSINIAAAIADPINYLNTLNLNLSSLENLVARRKPSVVEGDSSFAQPAENWTIAPNGDVSNLGIFSNLCMEEEVVYEFFIPGSHTLAEGTLYSVQIRAIGITDLNATHSVDITPVFVNTDCVDIFNTTPFADCDDVNMNNNNNCNSYTAVFDTPGAWITSFYLSPKVDNVFESQEVFSIVLNNPVGGSIGESFYSCKDIRIGASTNTNELSKLINIYSFPNPFSESINISNLSNKQIVKIEMVNVLGQTIITKYGKTENIETKDIHKGVYFLKYTVENSTYFEKIIKD